MHKQSKIKTTLAIIGAGLLATVMISCGDMAPEMMSDAMVDAGELLMDGGRLLMDGGGDLDAAADAMAPSDAEAQDSGSGSCGSCTVDGIVRVVTADSDPTRLEQGRSTGSGVVVLGPIVITDFALINTATREAGRGLVWVSSTASCAIVPGGEYLQALEGQGTFWSVHGARITVPSGGALCANSSHDTSWAGFRPY